MLSAVQSVVLGGIRASNRARFSEQFDNAVWIKGGSTISDDAIAAPNGSATADKIVESGTTVRHQVSQTVAAPGNLFSVYAKAGERGFIAIGNSNNSGLWSVSRFNLATGVYVASFTAGGEPAPTFNRIVLDINGFWRVSCRLTGSQAEANIICDIGTGDPIDGYAGDSASGIYVWGAQMELGGRVIPGPYLATTSVAQP